MQLVILYPLSQSINEFLLTLLERAVEEEVVVSDFRRLYRRLLCFSQRIHAKKPVIEWSISDDLCGRVCGLVSSADVSKIENPGSFVK
jgi:hypothetical protein